MDVGKISQYMFIFLASLYSWQEEAETSIQNMLRKHKPISDLIVVRETDILTY